MRLLRELPGVKAESSMAKSWYQINLGIESLLGGHSLQIPLEGEDLPIASEPVTLPSQLALPSNDEVGDP